ncbi:MAG: glycosyltransferase [Atopobiaceae bacterium]|nr:glycosyltransferase [Atopobiaceae bacterium]
MESPTTRRDDASQPCEDRPLVSVVVPFYNVEECVADCMDSLVHQDFDGYEVVCIDDGSTDGTGALLDAYAERHLNVRVFHFPNAGLSVARNRGVELARAELISFVDGDDFVSPYYLSALYRAYDGVEGRMVQAKHIVDTREELRKVEWPGAPATAAVSAGRF